MTAAEDGTILSVEVEGWAGDTSYTVVAGEGTRKVDAYEAGSALLTPGEKIVFPEPAIVS